MSPTPDPAAGRAPIARRGARDTQAPGSAGRPAPRSPVRGAGHLTSQRPGERQAARTPDPETAPSPPLGKAAVRVRVQDPAGGALEGARGVPAGSTGTLFTDLQDAERAAQQHARRAHSKAFLENHLAKNMTEAELEEQVRDACKKLGIIRFHVRFSLGTTPGLPDDILIGSSGILWRELKRQKGKPTREQMEVGAALTATGQDWAIWKPEDWFSGRITRELAAIAGVRPGGAA